MEFSRAFADCRLYRVGNHESSRAQFRKPRIETLEIRIATPCMHEAVIYGCDFTRDNKTIKPDKSVCHQMRQRTQVKLLDARISQDAGFTASIPLRRMKPNELPQHLLRIRV